MQGIPDRKSNNMPRDARSYLPISVLITTPSVATDKRPNLEWLEQKEMCWPHNQKGPAGSRSLSHLHLLSLLCPVLASCASSLCLWSVKDAPPPATGHPPPATCSSGLTFFQLTNLGECAPPSDSSSLSPRLCSPQLSQPFAPPQTKHHVSEQVSANFLCKRPDGEYFRSLWHIFLWFFYNL